MKIRAGAKYVRNDGVVVTLNSWKPPMGHTSQYKFVDHAHNNLYDENGIHDDRPNPITGEEEEWNIAGPYVPKEKR